jgi:tetratricopeptide (TPR) repeat protein
MPPSSTKLWLRAAVASLLCAGVLHLAPRASAAPSDEAETLVAQGLELRRARRDEEALAAFEEAYRGQATATILAQIALAEQALGRFVEAERHLSASLGTTEPWIEKRRVALEQALRVIQSRLSWLDVSSNVESAELWLDDRLEAKLPSSSLRVTSGAHRLSLRAKDGRSLERSVELGPGERHVLQLEFPALPQAVARAPSPERRSREQPDPSTVRTWAYASATLAGVALVEAVAASLLRLEYVDEYNSDSCAPDRSQRCAPYRKAADTFGTVALVGYAVAGAAGLTSVALFTEPWWNGGDGALPHAGLSVSGSF